MKQWSGIDADIIIRKGLLYMLYKCITNDFTVEMH